MGQAWAHHNLHFSCRSIHLIQSSISKHLHLKHCNFATIHLILNLFVFPSAREAGRQFLLSGEVLLLIFLANKVVLAVGRKHHLLPGMGSALLCNFLPFIGVVRTFLSSPLLRTFYLYLYLLLRGSRKWKKREIHFNENKVAASLFYSQFVNYISWQKFGSFDQG